MKTQNSVQNDKEISKSMKIHFLKVRDTELFWILGPVFDQQWCGFDLPARSIYNRPPHSPQEYQHKSFKLLQLLTSSKKKAIWFCDGVLLPDFKQAITSSQYLTFRDVQSTSTHTAVKSPIWFLNSKIPTLCQDRSFVTNVAFKHCLITFDPIFISQLIKTASNSASKLAAWLGNFLVT